MFHSSLQHTASITVLHRIDRNK